MQSLLRQAGWPESLIPIMAAIGMAESSGQPCIVGTLANNEYSVGLWQININPALRRPWTRQQLCDPLFNAQVALQIYRQQGLRAWGSYTDGRYRQYLAQSQAIVKASATRSGSQPPQAMPPQTVFNDNGNVETGLTDYIGEAPLVTPGIIAIGAVAIIAYLLLR